MENDDKPGMRYHKSGNLYVCDTWCVCVRKWEYCNRMNFVDFSSGKCNMGAQSWYTYVNRVIYFQKCGPK